MEITENVRRWLSGGERGISSETMVECMCGLPPGMLTGRSGQCHPFDPSDFGRCVKLLRSAPELRPLLPKMAEAGPIWAAMVECWERWEQMYDEAMRRPDKMARELYDEMKAVRGWK